MEELEEDPDMRARINLYKNPAAAVAVQAPVAAAAAVPGLHEMGDSDDDGEDLPQVGGCDVWRLFSAFCVVAWVGTLRVIVQVRGNNLGLKMARIEF
jgi:hypothetical protein